MPDDGHDNDNDDQRDDRRDEPVETNDPEEFEGFEGPEDPEEFETFEEPIDPEAPLDLAAFDEFEEFAPEDFGEGHDDPRPKTTLKRVGRGGQMIGAAMIGLAEILEPRPKTEVPVEIATPGEPPNIDTKGLDEPFGVGRERLVGPPMDRLKSKARAGRTVKRRR